ncbi:hypothetical protein HMPREF9123_0489 [Neisseria bacilliformis ATCC BAA-1200]|uniref:Uncharacterized protein n=1 Tax=Neisseria bacilliformis ATCC BAA-1200 TaxID=888742 RepID=F2B9T5_9NEIS|nr:hypothetical protein HMPREF9123_0489 [Neisseria bacilliformis ATCC BAA-1200]
MRRENDGTIPQGRRRAVLAGEKRHVRAAGGAAQRCRGVSAFGLTNGFLRKKRGRVGHLRAFLTRQAGVFVKNTRRKADWRQPPNRP